MADLAQLIADLETAQVGSLHYDKRILAALGFTWRGMAYWNGAEQWKGPAALTHSIDAIVALIERKLPGWWVQYLGQTTKGWSVRIERQGTSLGLFNSTTPALALCIAFLHALQGGSAPDKAADHSGDVTGMVPADDQHCPRCGAGAETVHACKCKPIVEVPPLTDEQRRFVEERVQRRPVDMSVVVGGPSGAWGPTHRHVKRGTDYEVLGEAELQVATTAPLEGHHLVVYRDRVGKLWARAALEFHDGRFSALGAGEQFAKNAKKSPASGRVLRTAVVLHLDTDGTPTLRVWDSAGEVLALWIDEAAPGDRVYEWTTREPDLGTLRALIGTDPVGNARDGYLDDQTVQAIRAAFWRRDGGQLAEVEASPGGADDD